MTIHHDKLAYGKLASSSEDISEERIAEMLKQLEENKTEEEKDLTKSKTSENKKD